MNLCPDERLLFVRMISAMLRRSGGDAGAVMFEAYRHIVSDTNQARRSWGPLGKRKFSYVKRFELNE